MVDILPLPDAIKRIPGGAILALGGMTLYRRPTALVTALLATQPRDLTLLSLTGGFEADLLIGAGCVRTCRTFYFGLEVFGPAPMYTRHAAELEIIEETESTICGGLNELGPLRALTGTDVLRSRPDIRIKKNRIQYPDHEIDVTLLHALEGDRDGNVRFIGNQACDRDLASRGRLTIASVERIVDHVEPGIRCDVLVEAPRGAWPSSCYPDYPWDGEEIIRYIRACEADRFEDYLGELLSR